MRGQLKAAVILLILHITTTRTAKSSAPSVHEVINEQARIDDKRPFSYGNPLAGNSQQNAKIHAQHQQAMFNAERVRQHRAQIQRWNKAPQQVDSYMKAYHESQETHQLALEQMQQPIQKDKQQRTRQERPNLRSRSHLDPVKLTRANAVDKNRNHRSYGSVNHKGLNKNKINTSPGTTYDQGVTIKPHGNIGLNNLESEQTRLYTEILPSKTQFIYPKLYSEMHTYQSADDLHALNTLLGKSPQEQITELNTLTQVNKEYGKDTLEQPIDLFFYLNSPNKAPVDNSKYTVQNTYIGPYANEYENYNDHKPITEEVVDIKEEKTTAFRPHPLQQTPTAMPHVFEDPTTTKSNYYKIEVEQTISGNEHGKSDEFPKSSYAAVTNEAPLNYYTKEPYSETVKYLQSQHSGVQNSGVQHSGVQHSEVQYSGVQHLSHDGTGVSAYGDDDVSIKKCRTKRQLDSNLFILENEPLPVQIQTPPLVKNITPSTQNNKTDGSVLILTLNKSSVTNNNDMINSDSQTPLNATDRNDTLPTPMEWKRYRTFDDHPPGEAKDYDYDYEDDKNNKDYSYDSDYDPDDEFNPPDLDYPAQSNYRQPAPFSRPNRPRNPNNQQNFDSQNRFSNRFANFKHPNYNSFHSEPSDDYGPPTNYGPPSTSYGSPFQQYGPPKSQFQGPKPEVSSFIDSLEPVYMLTGSQLKDIVAQKHMNVQHLEVFQYPSLTKHKKKHRRYPRRIKKHRQSRNRRPRKLAKFRKLNKLIHY